MVLKIKVFVLKVVLVAGGDAAVGVGLIRVLVLKVVRRQVAMTN